MSKEQKITLIDWPTLLQKLRVELDALDGTDRQWLRDRLDSIAAIQLELDDLFRLVGGLQVCAECDGACCGCGRHHVTLTNLLGYLIAGEDPPSPDFTRTCPYLGKGGCVLPVARRPYNCITFFCEQLEENLSEEKRQQLCFMDQQLRREYQALAERYPAASLRGIWIALERIGDGEILSTKQ
ncbi:MAG: hypothetical protein JRE01_05295 [Deltaproteobacteria bacterium]|jgi:hypothetical protein|nr:hypothetical protein [Deltaproteobacteria bacterium]MDH4007101.1 hypothetical protein [Desulfuromonadales bacterium]